MRQPIMHLNTFAGLLTLFHLIASVWSYGTIVQVYPSTCPAFPTGSSLPTATPSPAYLLAIVAIPINISPRAHLSNLKTFLGPRGDTTTDCGAAAPFSASGGRISSNGQFVSTTGLLPYSSFAPSSFIAAISTTFSVSNNSYLEWNNAAFTGTRALFCVMGTTVQAVYNGGLPAGCAQINLAYVPASSCRNSNPSSSVTVTTLTAGTGTGTGTGSASPSPTASVLGSIVGTNATANSVGCLTSSYDSPAILRNQDPRTVTTLEECLDSCSSSTYFGVQSGFCVCGDALAQSATPAMVGSCNFACAGNSAQNCGGVNAMTVYSIVSRTGVSSTMSGMSTTAIMSSAGSSGSSTTATTSSTTSYVTSTGVPNCFDRSPFDNTVNDGYLILCNTALSGFDLKTTNGTSLFDCIAACKAENSGPGNDTCVAVTFDIAASSDQCTLKTNIGVVEKGAQDLSEAAVVTFGDNVPQIVFASTVSTMSSTMTTSETPSSASTVLAISSTTTTSGMSSSASTVSAISTITAGGISSSASTVSAASSTITTSRMSSSSTISGSVTSRGSATSGTTAISSTSSTSTSQGPRPTVTNPVGPLCPTYNGQVVGIGGSFYQVQCSTDLIGETLVGNTTTAESLAECGGFCNLYNLAVPLGCIGVTMDTTSDSSNCYLKGRITGRQYSALNDSLRLIYAGYPEPTDPTLAGPSESLSSSLGSRSTTTTSTPTTSSTAPTATTALCPRYDREVVFFPSYGGSNYEIECATDFLGNDLTPVVATSLTDCIDQCSFLNVNSETPQCVAVTFLNGPQAVPPTNNCYPKNAVTTINRNYLQGDSARLIFSGYPFPTDAATDSSTTPSQTTPSSNSVVTTAGTTSITSSTPTTSGTPVPAPTGSLCPTYDMQTVQEGDYQYEIQCRFDFLGRDIGFPYDPYPTIQSFQQCLEACNYWNANTNTRCIAAIYSASPSECYLKDVIGEGLSSTTFDAARLVG